MSIGPSEKWARPGTVTLWAADRLSLAVVHGPGGFYALDLSHVPECPVNIREGEGWHVDLPNADIVFTCSDGSVWARFDRYGKSVPDAPQRDVIQARAVEAGDDGTLLVSHDEPPRPLTTYWPVLPTVLPSTASAAAQALFDAWQAQNRTAALRVASFDAVHSLWRFGQPDRYTFSGTCTRYCSFRDQAGLMAFYLVVKNTGEGYWVKRADLGTIEEECSPNC